VVSERTSLRGLRYTQTASVVGRGSRLKTFQPAVGPAEALELPQRPEWLEEAWKVTGAAGKPTTLAQLKAIERSLQKGSYLSTAASGHSYFRIEQLLLGDKAGHDAAYAEQRASAFAVLARSLGVPARVSVGYLLRKPAADGTYTVTTADVTAWPEVLDAELGWVAFNPTTTQKDQRPVEESNKGESSGGNTGDQAPENDLGPLLFDREEEPPVEQTGWRDALLKVGTLAAGLVGVLFAVLLLGALAKSQRRYWRRRRGSPAVRVLAAWHEMGDRLTERGHRPDPTLTPAELVLASRELVPAGAVQPLAAAAPLVSAALYAPVDPHEAEADRAWDLEATARGALRRGTPLTRRVRHWFSLRPLLPRLRRDT
jgi:hypothetical protein